MSKVKSLLATLLIMATATVAILTIISLSQAMRWI